MGVDILLNLKLYWFTEAKQPTYLRRKYVFSKISYKRFLFIRKHIRITELTTNEYTTDNKTQEKTKKSITNINNLIHKIKHPDHFISIHESTIAHKGRFGALVYNKTKPNRWGIKPYVLASSTSDYAHRISLYTGESISVNYTVEGLTKKLDKPHHLFIDNFYTTLEGIKNCLDKNIRVTGTCRPNRKDLPKKLIAESKKILKKGEMVIINNEYINAILLQDKKFVVLLSSSERAMQLDTKKQEKPF